jgi:hypothetical protein
MHCQQTASLFDHFVGDRQHRLRPPQCRAPAPFAGDVATRVGPIWGFGDGDELRNMFARTPQPGLWFIAGSFAQCRIYSKYLALQIKALEIGLTS